jgi:hypothetical protein
MRRVATFVFYTRSKTSEMRKQKQFTSGVACTTHTTQALSTHVKLVQTQEKVNFSSKSLCC